MNRKIHASICSIICSFAAIANASLTIDWTNTDATKIGTNFTLNIGIDELGSYSVVSTENVPAAMTFTATGSTSLPELTNKTFSLNFLSVNGQDFESHSSAGAYRIGLRGGVNIWRFDEAEEIARITADLSGLSALADFRLQSFQPLNSVSDFVIGLRDSSGTEVLSETNQTDLADIAPLLSGGEADFFDFRAETGSAGGWGSIVFEFALAPGVEAIQPANIFSSGCVLQRGQTVPVWGTSAPDDSITLTINGQTKNTVADSNGNWRVELDPETAGGPYTMTISGSNSLSAVLSEVYFGDVWILTGQSNMFQPIGTQVANFPNDYPAVPDATDDFDDVRFAIVDTISASNAPADDVTMYQTWNRWQADLLADMSAVGYFFTRALNESLDANGQQDVPLGIIKVCKGGTSIEEWIAAEKIDEAVANDPSLIIASDSSGYYNGMIAPIQDYSVKGALWYQGEGNSASTDRINQYPTLKQVLVDSWREQWSNPDLPFYYVQLAPYRSYTPTPTDELWPWMRESQEACLSITNTAMACIIDGGLQGNIHPPFKDRVGQRLARIALNNTYGISQITRGPVSTHCQFNGAEAVLTFDSVAAGLLTQSVDSQPDADELSEGYPAVSVSSNELAGFALCGSDQVFYWANDAEIISSNQVRISNEEDVPNPVAVRYAWQDYPRCNLFSSEGLPAEPFRTDSYDYLTSSGAMSTEPEFSAIYQDDFSGAATLNATDTVPEIASAAFVDVSLDAGLDGSGRLEATDVGSNGSNYRFQIADTPLTSDPSVGAIRYTATLRVPTNDWMMIGFHENSVDKLLNVDGNSGPMVQFSPLFMIIRAGAWGGGTVSETYRNYYVPGQVVTAEMTYHIVEKTIDLSVDGTTVVSGFAIEHEYPLGTNSNPVALWAQVQYRYQPSVADGGGYVDSLLIETNSAELGTIVYKDDFSGDAGDSTATVPEVAPVDFNQGSFMSGLDGNGLLQSTNSLNPSAGYRVKLGTDPLSIDPSIADVRLKVKMRVPTNDWVMIGFQEQDANALLVEERNAGPIVQFGPTYVIIRGGTWGGTNDSGAISETILNPYALGQTITAELTYHIAAQTVDLSINGLTLKEGFALDHEFPVGTNSAPVIYWLNSQMRFQPLAADGGSYIDSMEVRTVPTSYVSWSAYRSEAIGEEGDDYDGDGIPNLYEYGLGGDPADAADRGVSPEFQIDGGRLVYVHPKLSVGQNSGLRYHLEVSTNLVGGTWSSAGYVVMGTNVTGGSLDYVTNETDTAESSKFVRLIIE